MLATIMPTDRSGLVIRAICWSLLVVYLVGYLIYAWQKKIIVFPNWGWPWRKFERQTSPLTYWFGMILYFTFVVVLFFNVIVILHRLHLL
jgi:hypothetical protein